MKKVLLTSIFLTCVFSMGAQNILLAFKTIDINTQNSIEFDSIWIENLTSGCDTTIFATNPILILPMFVGTHENNMGESVSLQIKPNGPNPFCGNTVVTIYLSTRGSLHLVLSGIKGNLLAKFNNDFEAGLHKFEITSNCSGLLLLNAYNAKETKSIKLINNSEGTRANSIKYIGGEISIEKGNLKSSSAITDEEFIFCLGDLLQFTAIATGYNNTIFRASPASDTTYTIQMPLVISLATVSTASVTDIVQTNASGGGNISADGGSFITARGICWSTSPDPTTVDNFTIDEGGPGIFVSNLTGLTANTSYYVRAYAVNDVGTAYGNEVTFTTLQNIDIPAVTTTSVSNINQTTSTSGGNVTSDGGLMVTARGVCWSTSPNPLVTGNRTTDGTGEGTFVSNITGLNGSTLYFVRAYATNSIGTAYGNELTFTTLDLPTVLTTEVSNITENIATSGGYVISDEGATVTARGVCWSTSPNPLVTGNRTTDGTGEGTFVSNITGLNEGTVYFIRAYATNSVGIAYGNEFSFTTLN